MNTVTQTEARHLAQLEGARAMLALSKSLKDGYRPSLKSLCDMLREFDENLKHDPLYLWLDNTPAVCADDIEKAEWTAGDEAAGVEKPSYWPMPAELDALTVWSKA